MILTPFKSSLAQIGIVSFAGLRGVASIVFAIYIVLADIPLPFNIFNLVFVIVLLSLSFQGTLLPFVAKKLNMIDSNTNIFKTFNDYQEDSDVNFIKIHVTDTHPFSGKTIKDLSLPRELLAVLLLREQTTILPSGNTLLRAGDLVVFAAPEFTDRSNLTLQESIISKSHKWNGKLIKDIPKDKHFLIIMIKREDQTIIPNGDTKLLLNDIIVSARF